jgi:filamin
MELAKKVFGIPMVLEPEYLASPFLDELSGMTYLSYFMKENSPGFFATLRWVTSQIPGQKVKNFTVLTISALFQNFSGSWLCS